MPYPTEDKFKCHWLRKKNCGPPFHNSFFNFMSWNVNSIAKDDFQRVCLIEAHNSIFNYDLSSICETSLNDSIKLPDT